MSDIITEQPARLPNLWEKYEKCSGYAICNICRDKILTKNGSTTALHNHMREVHKITLFKRQRKSKVTVGVAAVTTLDALKKAFPMEAKLSRMTAIDRVTLNLLKSSDDIREGINATVKDVVELPKSDKTIKDLVMKHGERVREILSLRLQEMSKSGEFFSCDFDEWVSVANRRYLNVNIFDKSQHFWNLGLVRITGRATASNLLNLVNLRLNKFGLSTNKNIVCFITDGCRVMESLHNSTEIESQLCIVHAIQLAVLDVLYAKKDPSKKSKKGKVAHNTEVTAGSSYQIDNANNDDSDTTAEEIETVVAEGHDDDDLNYDDESEATSQFETLTEQTTKELQNLTCLAAIQKVRKIVVHFKRSAVDKEKLQRFVKAKFGEEKALMLDCSTRWSSLYTMIARYNEIRECVDCCLKEVTIDDARITAPEVYLLECLENILKPIMTTVTRLCRRDMNLLEAEEALKILFYILAEQQNKLSLKILERLLIRVGHRWTINAKVLKYLDRGDLDEEEFDTKLLSRYSKPEEDINAKFYSSVFDGFENVLDSETLKEKTLELFNAPDKKDVREHLIKILKRLCPLNPQTNTELAEPSENSEILEPPAKKAKMTFEELQEEAILQVRTKIQKPKSKETGYGKFLTQEMNFLEKHKTRGYYLEKVYNMLISIKPSSVESERCFSSASHICTKIRARFNDDTLDTLCFLRAIMRNSVSSPL